MSRRKRGLLVVNPRATTTTPRMKSVLTHALHDEVDLQAVTTEYKGHAADLAQKAREDGLDVVITLGGDGTINEVVNGMLRYEAPAPDMPVLACVPGGSANVFARSLGMVNDPVEATGQIIEGLRADSTRSVSLGKATYYDDGTRERWFTINAGMGLDAEIVAAMERQRAEGHIATSSRYMLTLMKEFFGETDRKEAQLTIRRPGAEPVSGVFLAIVQNTAPWTYLGPLPVNPSPGASFDTGLDVFAPKSLSLPTALRYGSRMLRASRASGNKSLLRLHDVQELTITSLRPTALQLDGEAVGEFGSVDLSCVADSLRVVTEP